MLALPAWTFENAPPYIIAEAGVNHNGKMEMALDLIQKAKEAGADAVKFQAYTAEELTIRQAPKAGYQETCGDPGESQYDMLKRYELSEANFATLKNRCDQLKIDFLATPFSPRWTDVLARLQVTSFKIGSGNLFWDDLLQCIGQKKMPTILSTGMSNLHELDKVYARLINAGCSNLAILHCVSCYPTPLDQTNLNAIRTLANHFNRTAGFSDHTRETFTGALAVAAGAMILEKHVTLDKTLDGPDHALSLTPSELNDYIKNARQAYAALGTGEKKPQPQELAIKKAVGMSIVSRTAIAAGTKITPQMLTLKRPGTGIPADQIEKIIGTTAKVNIPADQIISWDMTTPSHNTP